MYNVDLKEPSTLFSEDRNIIVLDENKNLFYIHPNKERFIKFNLPGGVFYIFNEVEILDKFEPYEIYKKPKLNYDPRRFNLIVKDNPHKATINTFSDFIKLDTKIAELCEQYQPLGVFLLAHELYHLKVGGDKFKGKRKIFDAEKACDNFAVHYMLCKGFNPSQIDASKEILSNTDRKNCISRRLTNKKFRR